MDLSSYRKYIETEIESFLKRPYGERFVRVKDLTDDNLRIFMETMMTPREQEATRLRFSSPQRTYAAIGQIMGISPARARQLVTRGKSKIFRENAGFIKLIRV